LVFNVRTPTFWKFFLFPPSNGEEVKGEDKRVAPPRSPAEQASLNILYLKTEIEPIFELLWFYIKN
jgi:hypothetical protein